MGNLPLPKYRPMYGCSRINAGSHAGSSVGQISFKAALDAELTKGSRRFFQSASSFLVNRSGLTPIKIRVPGPGGALAARPTLSVRDWLLQPRFQNDTGSPSCAVSTRFISESAKTASRAAEPPSTTTLNQLGDLAAFKDARATCV